VTITAELAAKSEINAKITVVLFKQGENSFDFDQATGGDRILAWQRTVSNSKTADNSVYYIVDPNEDMVTSYVLALDMYDHGHSKGNEANTGAFFSFWPYAQYDAACYMYQQPYVLKDEAGNGILMTVANTCVYYQF
jgi:hypothetical protein